MSKLIKVTDETHAELTRLGGKSETYDDIIRKLIRTGSSQIPKVVS